MSDLVLIIVGAVVIVTVLADLVSTTISLTSVRGRLSSRLAAFAWGAVRRADRMPAPITRSAGTIVLSSILIGWLAGLTLGWTLVFLADGSLEQTASAQQQSSDVRFVDSLFFVFGSLIGRGSSTLSPDGAWSWVEALMSVTGVGFVTLSLAWILPIVGAVVHKRSVASRLAALGRSPEEVIHRAWNGTDLGQLHLHLIPAIAELSGLAQRHLAYPVIHYFHSSDERTAIAPRLAVLDDTLTLLEAASPDGSAVGGVGISVIEPVRQAITDYLTTLRFAFIDAADEPPEPPEAARLRDIGMAGDGFDERLARRCEALSARRALLLGYVREDGHEWEIVRSGTPEDADDDPERHELSS